MEMANKLFSLLVESPNHLHCIVHLTNLTSR